VAWASGGSRGTGAGDSERGRGVAQWALIWSVAGWARASGSHGGLASQAFRSAKLTPVRRLRGVWGNSVGRSLSGPTPVAADRFALRARGG
jgi:hypothetical protein